MLRRTWFSLSSNLAVKQMPCHLPRSDSYSLLPDASGYRLVSLVLQGSYHPLVTHVLFAVKTPRHPARCHQFQWISSSSLSVMCQVVRSFGACIIETISRAHHPLTRKCLLVSVEATYIYSQCMTCPIVIRDSRAVDRTNSEWRHVVTSMCVTVQSMH